MFEMPEIRGEGGREERGAGIEEKRERRERRGERGEREEGREVWL